MAYNDTPLPTDLISDSQPDIRENFQLLEDSQVVDEGSTDDGDYIRYENGWQVCFNNFALEDLSVTNSIGSLYQSENDYTWNYPQSFIDDNVSMAGMLNGRDLDDAAYVSRDGSPRETYSNFLINSPVSSSSATQRITLIAIGRWK